MSHERSNTAYRLPSKCATKGVQSESMKTRFIISKPLADLAHSLAEEVAKHKWIESQKAGRDIGDPAALEDWLQFHFPNWARLEKNRAIEQALHADEAETIF